MSICFETLMGINPHPTKGRPINGALADLPNGRVGTSLILWYDSNNQINPVQFAVNFTGINHEVHELWF